MTRLHSRMNAVRNQRASPRARSTAFAGLAPLLLSFIGACLFAVFFAAYGFPSYMILGTFTVSTFLMLLLGFNATFSPKYSLFLLMFSFYHVFILIIPGMFHIANGTFPFYGFSYPLADIQTSSIIVLLFSISVSIGRAVYVRNPQSREQKAVNTYEYSIPRLMTIILVLTTAAFLASLSLGFGELTARRGGAGGNTIDLSIVQNQVTLVLARFGSYLAAISSWLLLRRQICGPTLLLATLTTALFVTVNLPWAVPRYYLFGYLLGVLYLFFDMRSAKRKLSLFLSMAVALNLILPYLNAIQRRDIRDLQNLDPIEYYSSSGDYDSLQSVLNVINWIEIDGPQYGRQLLGAVFSMVPRALWTDKPLPTGTAAGQVAGYDYLNLSAPLFVEYYADFWFIGVIVLGILTGYFVTRMDFVSVAVRERGDLMGPLLFAVLIGFETIVLRGTLAAAIAPVGLLVALTLIVLWFGRVPNVPKPHRRTAVRGTFRA